MSVQTLHSDQISPEELKAIFKGRRDPLVIKGQLSSWMTRRSWGSKELCQALGNKKTTFKICPKAESVIYKRQFGEQKEAVYETQCEFIEATFSDFHAWLTSSSESQHQTATKRIKLESPATECDPATDNPLLVYPQSEYWIYADYKYMCQLCEDMPELLDAVDWSPFGFEGRGGEDSTLWIGSEGAFTPCHYDTYGCNLVAQLSGQKKWLLFSPEDSDKLYPTRVPYEESSVFSAVNISSPNLKEHPKFADATEYKVVLQPGDVLYVPRHWWHFVESVGHEPTVSINTWIVLNADVHEKLKEAIVRTMVSVFSKDMVKPQQWINPNEVIFSTEENLHLLSQTLASRREQMREEHSNTSEGTTAECSKSDSCTKGTRKDISIKDFLHALTNDTVVDTIADFLLQ